MEINNSKMCSNEVAKVALLISEASRLERDISGYGMCDVNPTSGNVYLWLEDYQTTLFIGPCDSEIQYHWSCGSCGEEYNYPEINPSEQELEEWVDGLSCEDCDCCVDNCSCEA